ncbi:MAG: hypothetical protein GWM90_23820, partial [Gemmatimonadetes bacterium]|nr:hypothetical protein [Gemmatimonadota bacterium]NIQ57737.1 hypothetical protein [Gemmatimonadota bacterium]NIU77898.1 hypothetical protein [Gammaproteobacteria bacterium]NIX46997.1 hypothetical protein [Gemmatimonadota bacterium]NIY11650.1 hypothetical protein [Gemmatimonadota bacterium]
MHTPPARTPLRLLVLVGVAACSGQDGVGSPSASHMYDHFQRAAQIQTAIIEARLERARGPATWMAEHERGENLPTASVRYIADMRSLASRVADAGTLAEAGEAAARM